MTAGSKTYTGFLVYFDIVGFSNYLKTSDFSNEFSKFCEILNSSIEEFSEKKEIQYHFFSDSIVLFTSKTSKKVFINFIKLISKINFEMVLNLDLIICGTLSYGKFTIHENQGNIIIAGNPIVEAVQFEQQQNWLGIMIAPSVIKKVRYLDMVIRLPFTDKFWDTLNEHISDRTMHYYVHNINIPIKLHQIDDDIHEGLIILPITGIASKDNIHLGLNMMTAKLSVLKLSAPDRYSQDKYRKTIEIYQNIKDRIMGIEKEFFLPAEDETDT